MWWLSFFFFLIFSCSGPLSVSVYPFRCFCACLLSFSFPSASSSLTFIKSRTSILRMGVQCDGISHVMRWSWKGDSSAGGDAGGGSEGLDESVQSAAQCLCEGSEVGERPKSIQCTISFRKKICFSRCVVRLLSYAAVASLKRKSVMGTGAQSLCHVFLIWFMVPADECIVANENTISRAGFWNQLIVCIVAK